MQFTSKHPFTFQPTEAFCMNSTKHLLLSGRVQGVFFRESLSIKAQELGVTGWVRNRSDGSLEAMIQGTDSQINEIIEWASTGPELAHVERVEISEGSGNFVDFKRLQTV